MTNYYFTRYKDSFFHLHTLVFIILILIYLSPYSTLGLNLASWRLQSFTDIYLYLRILIPVYLVIFLPVFFNDTTYCLVRSKKKANRITKKLIMITGFNISLFLLIYAAINHLGNFLFPNEFTEPLCETLQITADTIYQSFGSFRYPLEVLFCIFVLGFSGIVLVLVLVQEKWGSTSGMVVAVLYFGWLTFTSQTFATNHILPYELFNLKTYLLPNLTSINENRWSLSIYLLLRLLILTASIVFLFILNTRRPITWSRNFNKIHFILRLYFSNRLILITGLFGILLVTSFHLIYRENWFSFLLNSQSYSFSYLPKMFFGLPISLLVPCLMSVQFSTFDHHLAYVEIRWKSRCSWQWMRLFASLFILMFFFIGLVSGCLLNGGVTFLVSADFWRLFLELFGVTIFFNCLYIYTNSTMVSFLGCIFGYLISAMPFDKTKQFIPFGSSSSVFVKTYGSLSSWLLLFVFPILCLGLIYIKKYDSRRR